MCSFKVEYEVLYQLELLGHSTSMRVSRQCVGADWLPEGALYTDGTGEAALYAIKE